MSLTLEAKKTAVDKVAAIAAAAPSAIAAEYIGLTATEMTALRKAARTTGVYVKIVRNTLARRAFKGTPFECMNDSMVGPLLLVFSNDDPGSAARVVRDFSEKNTNLVTKVIALDGQLLAPSELQRLANIPSIDEARSTFLSILKAPLAKFVRTLAEPQAKFTRLLMAYRKQKDA